MKLFSAALIVLSLSACTQPKSAPPTKKATMSSSATQDGSRQAGSQSSQGTGTENQNSDSGTANEKKSKQFFYMDTADSFVCSSIAYDNPVSEAKATEGGMKPGTCPTTNSLNAGVLVSCEAIHDTDSLSTIQALIYKKGNDVDGSSVELTKEQGTAICADMKSGGSDE